MDSHKDFLSAFSEAEIHSFTCETLKDRGVDPTVYIRSIPWAVKNQFWNASRMIVTRLCVIAEKSVKDEDSELIWNEDIKTADMYLLKEGVCNPDGSPLWTDETLSEFLKVAKPECVEEIIDKLNSFNKLGEVWQPQEDQEKEVKKN